MVTAPTRYDLDSVKRDVKSFFENDAHRAYQYGSKATACGIDSIFYKKQIQVIFEEWYPHDVTNRAVNELISDDFLRDEPRTFGSNTPIIFICKRSRRYASYEIRSRIKIIERFSDAELNEGCGKYTESLFNHMFGKYQFEVIDTHTNTYKGKTWTGSKRDLDFIIAKDGVTYGGEIKDTFDYMPQDEFEDKLEMCRYFGILPMFPLRFSSPQQYELMKNAGGLALTFRTRIFPPGNQKLVTDIWNHFRLPVHVWYRITTDVERIFLEYHQRNII